MAVAACSSGARPSAVSSPPLPVAPAATITTKATAGSSTDTWVAPDYGAAAVAVRTYLAFMAVWNRQLVSTRPAASSFDAFLYGQAKQVFDANIAADPDTYYRGQPPTSRVVVTASRLSGTALPTASLTDCPLPSATDPLVAYSVKTGKPVPVTAAAVAPPYESTIRMFEQNGHWAISSFSTDYTKTCAR